MKRKEHCSSWDKQKDMIEQQNYFLWPPKVYSLHYRESHVYKILQLAIIYTVYLLHCRLISDTYHVYVLLYFCVQNFWEGTEKVNFKFLNFVLLIHLVLFSSIFITLIILLTIYLHYFNHIWVTLLHPRLTS